MTVDVLGTRGDQSCVGFFGYVVVVAVEAAAGDAVQRCEVVELLERPIAHQMSPKSVVRGPPRVVDQDRHITILGTDAATRPVSLLRLVPASGKVVLWCVPFRMPHRMCRQLSSPHHNFSQSHKDNRSRALPNENKV